MEYNIEGITVRFPYEAYPCQIKYMERVIACLNKRWNGILESPTGTGKTLCLLCACLAWQQEQKRQRLKEAAGQLAAYSQSVIAGEDESTIDQCIVYPRIMYTSRTHMQLSQVIRELNKTAYKTVKTCLMGSRDQLCLNEVVMKEQNSSIKNHLCRTKVKKGTCHYYNGYEASQTVKKTILSERRKTCTSQVLDIEDFISHGQKNKICPFYASRDKPEEADLILMPYNYVVDAKARKANKIDLNNVILIFDEGHNLEQVCEESASITLSTKDITGSLRESKEALSLILLDEAGLRQEMDESKAAFGAITKEKRLVNIEIKELTDMIVLLEDLDKEVEKIDLNATSKKNGMNGNSLSGLTRSGSFMFDLLRESGISPYMRESMYNLIDKLTSYLTEKAANSSWQSRGAHLQKLASLLNTVFIVDDEEDDFKHSADIYKDHLGHFKVYISSMEEEKRPSSNLNNYLTTVRRQCLHLNYWCFNAGLTMESLVEKGVYSILVTSGTLSPLSQFQLQMKIPFHLTLENDHVINANQAWFGVICNGPDGCPLDASYANRQNDTYVSSLGNMLINVFRIVPEGCLVFFASYAQMTACIEKWQAAGVWSRMTKHKALYVEPKSKQEFYQAIGDYNTVVKTKPAAFFAVCRGKVSEGIDFADSAARAVVMLGIPFPPMYEPRVILKKEYLGRQDQMQRNSSQANSESSVLFDGETWYRTEAIRAVNQSIGRVIRHKDDYGAVIMADQRFATWNKNRFPSWIIPNYCSYTKFGEFSKSLAQFFKDKGPNVEKFTAIKPKETYFEENTSVRKRDIDGKIKMDAMGERSGTKQDSYNCMNSVTANYVNAFSPSSGWKRPQPANGAFWESLDSGRQISDSDLLILEEYRPSTTRQLEPVECTAQRRRIKITKETPGRKETDDCGKTDLGEKACCVPENTSTAKAINPATAQKALEYRDKVRQILKPDDCKQFYQLAKMYKQQRQLDPLLDFFQRLPFPDCSDVMRGFIDCIHQEHKAAFAEFLKKLGKT